MSAESPSHREIERKFLVNQLPDNLPQYSHREIEQGYLAIAPGGVQVRLRKAGDQHSLTFKSGGGTGEARVERETALSVEQFAVLWPATLGKRLLKTRYDVPFENRVVEIDIYSGKHQGLVVAEVEFDDLDSARAFQPPAWLGRDVSGSSRYSNVRLAS